MSCFFFSFSPFSFFFFFFFNDTATTEIYTLSLHDALPISSARHLGQFRRASSSRPESARLRSRRDGRRRARLALQQIGRDTSELQSLAYLVCRLLLEKKKKKI